MDLVLEVADTYFFDSFWATLVPASAFIPTIQNATASIPPLLTSSSISSTAASKWSQVISYLPHPPLPISTSPEFSSIAANGLATTSAWPRDYIPRQILSLVIFTYIGIHILYFLFAGLSYMFIFNHEMMNHPRFLKNQVRLEIKTSLKAFPVMILLTLPWFQGEVMGYSQLYDGWDTYGYTYLALSPILFLLFTDYCIYWIHRWLHIPFFYKRLHKPHHKWIIPTPFASHAFHPVDGYLQSIPYHLFVFLFPLHRLLYLVLFVAVNFWSIFIHDSDMVTGTAFEKVINGPAHHTLHHIYFTVNYGQYFTWADRYGNSYRQPMSSDDPLLDIKHDHDDAEFESKKKD